MKGRNIDWPGLAKKNGFKDPVTMVDELRAEFGTLQTTAEFLGMSVYPLSRFIKKHKLQVKRKCKFCGQTFLLQDKAHNREICYDKECIAKKKDERRLMKLEWKKRNCAANKSYRKNGSNETGRKCIKCGAPVTYPNMFRCNDCLVKLRGRTADMYDAYGEQSGAYI